MLTPRVRELARVGAVQQRRDPRVPSNADYLRAYRERCAEIRQQDAGAPVRNPNRHREF